MSRQCLNIAEELAIYAKAGFVARQKGQRRVPYVLPDFLGSNGQWHECSQLPLPDNLPVSVELLGVWVPQGGYCHGRNVHCWAVTLKSGMVVPAYSLGATYVVCQNTCYHLKGE